MAEDGTVVDGEFENDPEAFKKNVIGLPGADCYEAPPSDDAVPGEDGSTGSVDGSNADGNGENGGSSGTGGNGEDGSQT